MEVVRPDGGRRSASRAGALLALAIDVGLLAVGSTLVFASITPAFGLVLAGLLGLPIAPILGWRFGPLAVDLSLRGWSTEAVRTVLLIGVRLAGAFAFLGLFVAPIEGGPALGLSLVLYRLLIGSVVAVVATFGLVVPLGFVWKRLMARFAPAA